MAQAFPGVGAEVQTGAVEEGAHVGELAVERVGVALPEVVEVVLVDREIFLVEEQNTDHPHLTLGLAGVRQEASTAA